MTPRTERLYRGLLLAYPSRYRLRFADEIMGVLMEAADEPGPRRGRPGLSEATTLVVHGLAMRLRIRGEPGTWRRPLAAVATVLATLLAVMGGQQVVQAVDSGLFFGRWHADYLLLAAGLSIGAWVLFLLRWQIPALLAAGAASSGTIWLKRNNFNGLKQWGHRGAAETLQSWDYGSIANRHAFGMALLVPGVLLVLLLFLPGTAARSAEVYERRMLIKVLLAGLVVAAWTDHAGMSQIWATVVAGLLLLPGLFRERVVLRAGLLIAFAFSYLPLSEQADGSGSKIPRGGLALASTLAVIPVLLLLLGIVVLSQLEASHTLRERWGARIEDLGRSVRGTEPDDPEPV